MLLLNSNDDPIVFPVQDSKIYLPACSSPLHRCTTFLDEEGPFWQKNPLHLLFPKNLQNAVTKRRIEFIAGRSCALLALRSAGYLGKEQVGVSSDRSPIWPSGYIGSITHTSNFVAATAISNADWRSIGIDSESMIRQDVLDTIKYSISTHTEREINLHELGLTQSEYFTLLFSAKESVYKCLFPLTHQFLDFQQVELIAFDMKSKTFAFRFPDHVSPEFGPGQIYSGGFDIYRGMAHTAVGIRRTQNKTPWT